MTPEWSIAADGEDATARLARYLLSLEVVDKSGMEADELSIEIADPQARLAVPRLGAVLSVTLGYLELGSVAMGEYVVDSVEIASPPRTLAIRGHAADLRGDSKERRTRAFEDQTLGDIAATLGGELDLTPAVAPDLAGIEIARIDQTAESNLSFLTRLAQLYDAIATPKAGRIVIAKRGSATSASGSPIGAIGLGPADLTEWRIALSQTDRYTAAKAKYRDLDAAQDEWVTEGQADDQSGGEGAAEGSAVYRLRGTFPDRASAQAAARSKRAALARGESALSLSLPGRTDLAAETPLELSGIAPELDGRWIVTEAAHRLDSAGYVTRVQGEREVSG